MSTIRTPTQIELEIEGMTCDSCTQHDYDLIVIGSGGGGMAAAIKAAELGYRAAIIESGTMGGTCVNIGCVPSKTLIRAAAAYHHAGQHGFEGIQTRAEGLDWPALMAHKDELVRELRQAKYINVLASYGDSITLIRGWARLKSEHEVALSDGRVFTAGKIVLAAEGGEIIQTAALAIRFGLQYGFTLANLREIFFPYLTQVEGLKLAAQGFEKDVAQLSCCAG